jgi:glycosyltransferase involved in cell wall biosynthesis
MTVSMLEGTGGVLRREFDKLLEWLRGEPAPQIVNLPNSLLIGLARPIRDALRCPVVCTLQGEDLFLSGLVEPYRSRSLDLIRRQVPQVDRFVAVSRFCGDFMGGHLRIPADRMSIVALGIDLRPYEGRAGGKGAAAEEVGQPDAAPFRVGYLARVAPEKGLQLLAESYAIFRRRHPEVRARLLAAGYLAPGDRPYLDRVRQSLEESRLGGEFEYKGAVDLEGKLSFLRSIDVLSVPATYDEPKGIFLLEAMAAGVPAVQPRRGAFTEIIEATGGGLLCQPDDADSLAEGLEKTYHDPEARREMGERGRAAVHARYSVQRSADQLLSVYDALLNS